MSGEGRLRLLVDTNVWLDRYLVDRTRSAEVSTFLTEAFRCGAVLLYPTTCPCDVFFSICSEFKRSRRREKGVVSAGGDVRTIRRIAWASIDNMCEITTAVGVDESDLWLACKYRNLTWDLEDSVVLAAPRRAEVDYLVTSDQALIQKASVAVLTPVDMTALLREG